MKYLKYSLLIFICSVIINATFAFAYTNGPLNGTVQVTSFKWDKTGNVTKTNTSWQKIQITSATCDGCQFTAKPYQTNGTTVPATEKISVGVTKSLDSRASVPGDWYADIKRYDFSIVNQSASYKYDPNALVL